MILKLHHQKSQLTTEDKTLKFKLWLLVCMVILGTGNFWEGTFISELDIYNLNLQKI